MREEADISGTPGEAHRERKARLEIDRTAATEPVKEGAKGPARPMAKDTNDQAGKRGRQMNARLVRMHGGLVIEGR